MPDNANELKAYLDKNHFLENDLGETREEISQIAGINPRELTFGMLRSKVDSLSEDQVIRIFQLLRSIVSNDIGKEISFKYFDPQDTL